MSLDIKHMNIGATVEMLRMMTKLDPSGRMDTELTELFMLESAECSYKWMAACVFNGSLKPNMLCCIGECPLGAEVSKKLKNKTLNNIENKVKEI